jgi:hypothetical protein
VIQAKPAVTGNSTKDNMNKIMNANGYDREAGSTGPHDTDHIIEKQLGGPDDLSNLWPLNASTNRSSGGTIRGEISRIKKEHHLKDNEFAGKFLKLKA